MAEQITRLDFTVLYGIQDTLRCPFLDFLMPKITFLGNAGLIWILSALILLLFPKYRCAGILVLIGLCAGVLIGNVLLKNLFARPRPCFLDSTVQLLIGMPKDYSFPSGHTLSSVIAAAVLTMADHRFAGFAVPLAVLIALSRLYLFVHFPTDILASVILGLGIGILIRKCGGMLLDRVCLALQKRRN